MAGASWGRYFYRMHPALTVKLFAVLHPTSRVARRARSTSFALAAVLVTASWSRQPRPADRAVPVPVDDSASVVPGTLWRSLATPDAATLDWLSKRIPGLDAGTVRTLTTEAFDAMLADAAARNLSPVDFFTDPGFRGRDAYYVPQATLTSVFGRYEVRVLTAVSGHDTDGQPFQMSGLVLGGGRIDALYDRDDFTFVHPDFDNNRYTLAARVSQGILGPGDMTISGITAHVSFLHARIQRITKLSPTLARIKTSIGSRNKPAMPIRRR